MPPRPCEAGFIRGLVGQGDLALGEEKVGISLAPVVASAEGQGFGMVEGVAVGGGELGLVLLGEKVDGAAVGAVVIELPGTFLEVLHGDARVVLQNVAAAAEDGAADLVEVRFVHEVGGRLHIGSERAKMAHKFEGGFFGVELPVAEVGGASFRPRG